MSLRSMMTTTASTTRTPAKSGGKVGAPVTNLTLLKIMPVMLSDTRGLHQIRQAIGLDGTAVQVFETYTESHLHTDSGTPVTQLPDIVTGDRLVVGSITYEVLWCEQQPATFSFGATLLIYVMEDKRG
jgi:hypothetical protein